ncbi:dynamin [Cohnella sp. CFH 77786]|uniref:dynamin family protein n=1 Tax=Cohnella sp. CFH 77786 TaxID=2662265 RepID=UPI001C609F6B|nr:dynamin family protein [Cohnella sp. CFH 77786]MBW5446565.1 dynamin [Cohnella sp. CFH 77786]
MNRPQETAATAERTESIELEKLREAIIRMSEFTQTEGDPEQGGKYRELAGKLEKGLLTVAFCGHFSAGKSTLVNALCGANLLPSSPIPTSANVVTVRNGSPSARMVFRGNDGSRSEEREIPTSELHDFAVDGEGVASIEVTYPIPLLGDRMAIVDTPGVDSTDSAHRAATESALHLADVVFYVTDYNHVLSDVNFRFLRALSEWGKPVYVIVNQIDKHRESEVSFASFREGIVQAMEAWKIQPVGLLFLSLREPAHPLSQWEELQSVMTRLQPLRAELMIRSAERSARYLADRFLETLQARQHEEKERLLERMGVRGGEGAETLETRRARLEAEVEAFRSAPAARREVLRSELDRLLANANLTPAETRDKAADVLASLQPGFKAGWFAGASKTEAERERRLAALADDFNRQISAHLSGHVRELLRRAAREAGWDGAEMEASLASAFAPVTAEWLRSRVKPGMGADGQATLHYAAELSADVKGDYRKAALAWNERLEERKTPEREREERRLEGELADLRGRETAAKALAELEAAERTQRDRLLERLPDGIGAKELGLPVPEAAMMPEELPADPGEARPDPKQSGEAAETDPAKAAPVPIVEPDLPLGMSGAAAGWLERAAKVLAKVPALAKTADGLSAKAARYRDRRFTIALFGAFSAGKSSFANALVGRPALPVSPNPTTATINRIVAPTAEHPDGTAWITMKTKASLLGDIRQSLKRLGIPAAQIGQAGDDAKNLLALASRLPAEEVHPRGKPHLAFLKAASEGWQTYAGRLDTSFMASGEDYRRYAADEQASCFVAEIDLAVDAPLTRGGAVLVDTPGADSINARHTGVAFEYIKNADAVLFVTYYNHAFTEADRQFLNQLGSVKDVFELDKMFFLINAADLASSDSELAAVKEHVASQLLKHGIRHPRLFAVSSLNGLQAKQAGDREALEISGLAAFEASFRAFAGQELGDLAAASARKELERAGRQLDSWLHSVSADAASRAAEAERLFAQARAWREQGTANDAAAAVHPLLQEISEQLYHLRQRVFYRFNEHFQSAFHPSVLQDDGRDLKKLLTACWEDLRRGVGEDLQQELRSAGLRIEIALQRTVDSKMAEAASALAAAGFSAEPSARPEIGFPAEDPLASGPDMEAKRLWQLFKSPKHFFENDGKLILRDTASELLFRTADDSLARLRERWDALAAETCRGTLRHAYAELAGELEAYAGSLGESGMTDGLASPEDIRALWQQVAREAEAE